jgi:hypothetical protein
MDDKPYIIDYEFCFPDGRIKKFNITFAPETFTIINKDQEIKPPWTKLDQSQCTCCPLDPKESSHCPVAVNLAEMVESFKDTFSFDDCLVRCITPERTYIKESSIQEGLFSVFGIIMATSNCPIMAFFKPMARFHLPFSTIDETVFRSTSVYLFRQYFEYKNGGTPDMHLTKLDEHYKKVQEVNKGMLGRINMVVEKDADMNAIIILNAIAQIFSTEIESSLNSFEYLFNPVE